MIGRLALHKYTYTGILHVWDCQAKVGGACMPHWHKQDLQGSPVLRVDEKLSRPKHGRNRTNKRLMMACEVSYAP